MTKVEPQLLALDIDGTLMDDDGVIPARNVAALSALRDRGVAVVLSSGRALVSIRTVAAGMFLPCERDYYIAFNGALVAGHGRRRPIWATTLEPAVIREVAAYAREHGLVLQGYRAEEFVVERDSPESQAYAEGTGMPYHVVEDMAAAVPGGSPKLLAIGDPRQLLCHAEALRSLGRGAAVVDGDVSASGDSAPRFITTFSKPHYLEIMPPGVTKGEGLRRLCEYLDVPLEAVVAVGDSLNDVEMLTEAGVGVAVGNAREAVKARANAVIEETAGDGAVAAVVDRYFGVL
ncbi:MAG: HAD family hydrolase [Spirochaetaceae bacterium]